MNLKVVFDVSILQMNHLEHKSIYLQKHNHYYLYQQNLNQQSQLVVEQ